MVKTQSSLPNFMMIFANDWLGVIAVAKRTRRSHERHIAKEHLPYPQFKRFFFSRYETYFFLTAPVRHGQSFV